MLSPAVESANVGTLQGPEGFKPIRMGSLWRAPLRALCFRTRERDFDLLETFLAGFFLIVLAFAAVIFFEEAFTDVRL
jgi:hypothetical protein